MEVHIKYNGVDPNKEQESLINKFIDNLKKSHPLKDDVTVIFQNKRTETMTTGLRTDDHKLKILVKDRINRDILKTLSHEWVHEYQRTVLNRKQGKDVGGKNEDEANAKAGKEVKDFEYKNKKIEKSIYKPFQERIENLESELQVESTSKQLIISEIKKISIDKLPYDFNDVNVFIDSETMKTHYNKHYKGYVEKLNVELEKIPGKDIDLENIIKKISSFNTKVKNNGGGAFNHALFWKMLTPKTQKPTGGILEKIKKDFTTYQKFQLKFEEIAKERFGSGWVWLVLTKKNTLKIVSTPNQDNPLMNVVEDGGYPLLGLDLWEHAYYLKYRNKRDEYIKNFWKAVNWEFVNELLDSRVKNKLND